MGGDYSRDSFDSRNDFAAVNLQQGHPVLDSDFNEFVAIADRRTRAETVDTIGRATVPSETPTGFQITPTAGPAIGIGRGRMYVDGILAECHGRIVQPNFPPAFDRERVESGRQVGVLDELISSVGNDSVDYMQQPYWPAPEPLPDGGPHLVYIDVWRREITALKDPRLLDPALTGIDTATRWQSVWQVRLLANAGANATCGSQLDAWDDLIAPSPARLTTDTVHFEKPEDPCLIPPGAGYRGLENQFYRVEIHTAGGLGAAKFKWSRDNASVGATIESFTDAGRVRVRRIGRDQVLRFETGDWVEVTDDRREFAGVPGDICRIKVEPETNELLFAPPLSADLVPTGGDDTPAARHSRVIKWDQAGKVLLPDGTLWVDLDASGSDGLVPVPADGRAIILEAGLTVKFTTADPARAFRPMDYWSFDARTVEPWIQPLVEAPPRGIHHHYARLALVTFPGTVVDCRTFWPPVVESGEECGCTVCVSAEGHNSGALTINQAISQLPPEGGTVCLGPGEFHLGDTPIVLADRRSTRLKGHGAATQLTFVGRANAAIEVSDANDVRISDLNVAALAYREGNDEVGAILLRDVVGAAVERVGATATAIGNGEATAIILDGKQIDTLIGSCALTGTIGVGAKTSGDAAFVALLELRIAGTTITAERRAISLDGRIFHLGAVHIEGNLLSAGEAGIIATGIAGDQKTGFSAAPLRIVSNGFLLRGGADGIVSSVPECRISDNELVGVIGGREGGGRSGIVLRANRLPEMKADVQIVGNRIGRLGAFGILVQDPICSLFAKRNLISDCGMSGFVMSADASAELIALENNRIERVGLLDTRDPQSGARIMMTADARVVGNEVIGVAPADRAGAAAEYWAGIELRGVLSADVAHNVVTEIGAGQKEGFAVGILVYAPIGRTSVQANQVFDARDVSTGEALSWSGIIISAQDPRAAGSTFTGNLAYTPVLAEYSGRLFGLTLTGIRAAWPIQVRQVSIAGNQISDSHNRSRYPLVLAMIPSNYRATLQFSGNQVQLLTAGVVEAIVELGASQVIASHNSVARVQDTDAIAISCPGGDRPNAVVIGNITMGHVRINGNPPPPPFDALNLLG